MQLPGTTHNYSQPPKMTHKHPQHSQHPQHPQPPTATQIHSQPPKTVFNHPPLTTISYNHLHLPTATYNHPQPPITTRSEPLKTTRKKRIVSIKLVINNPEVIIYSKKTKQNKLFVSLC